MKGVPIKFRGKAENGEYVYGDLMQGNYDESAFHIKPRKKCPVYVDKNSVAQLVGYDSNGDEVYEDDRLILGSHEYIAGIRPVSYTDDKKYYKPEKDFSYFRLKENKKMTEKILPLPVTKNKFGQRVADISTTNYYRQIAEEVLEAHEEAVIFDHEKELCFDPNISDEFWNAEAEELVDIITCCITRLDILGYDESARQNLYHAVNEKNRKRGYFNG